MQIVNGFVCFNCTDEANAKKHIDPAHPTHGPAGAASAQGAGKPGDSQDGATGVQRPDAVIFGGTLSALNATGNRGEGSAPYISPARGLDVSA